MDVRETEHGRVGGRLALSVCGLLPVVFAFSRLTHAVVTHDAFTARSCIRPPS
jgi:hypothetical protein